MTIKTTDGTKSYAVLGSECARQLFTGKQASSARCSCTNAMISGALFKFFETKFAELMLDSSGRLLAVGIRNKR